MTNQLLGDIIYEFSRAGAYTRVRAMHAPTLTEVTINVPAALSEVQAKQMAHKRLVYVMNKQNSKA